MMPRRRPGLAGLDVTSAALRDGTAEMSRRLRAVQAYLDASGGGPAVLFGDDRLPQRFWSKVEVDPSACWLWTAGKNDRGYGLYHHAGVSRQRAHRVAYAVLVGPIPGGLHLDHLCRVRHCVNPAHLEPVTRHENTLRGRDAANPLGRNFCPKGHEYTPENTLYPNRPAAHRGRQCRACRRLKPPGPRRPDWIRKPKSAA